MSETVNPFGVPEEPSNPFEETGDDTDQGFDSFNKSSQLQEEDDKEIQINHSATIQHNNITVSESVNPFDESEDPSNPFEETSDPGFDSFNNQHQKETSNPFEETSETDPGSDSFNHQRLKVESEEVCQIDQTATIQVDEKKTLENLPTYTSLEEEQVNTIMRSVSMDDSEVLGQKKELSDSNDLLVKVDSPEKHVEGYVSYSVSTQTTREDFGKYDFKVRRRFQDFLWLKHKLQEEYSTHIIPALPEKFTFTKHLVDKYDPDFLKTRQKALDKFMSRVVEHPVLSFSENLKTFLSAKAWEMTTARKKGPGAASKVGGTVKNTAAQIMMKNREEEFEEGNQYINAFQAKMKSFAVISDQIARERFFLLEDFTEYGSAFRLWSNSESKLAETLNTVAESIDKKCENLKSILRIHELRFCEPMREYMLYCDSVKLASKKRDQVQIEHELVLEELAKRKAEKEEVESGQAKSFSSLFVKDPEKAKEERLVKINQQIQDLLSESESLSNNRTTADENFRADMERWNKGKLKDMKALLIEIAERHIKLHEANINAWQSSLEVISNPRKMHSGLE